MSRSPTLILLIALAACGTSRTADAGTPADRERAPDPTRAASPPAAVDTTPAHAGRTPPRERITVARGTVSRHAGSDTTPGHARSSRQERVEFTGGNSTREYRLQLPAGAERATFRFTFHVDEGTVLWFLFDPAGEVRWSGRKDADDAPDEIVGDFDDGPAGDWKLVIDLRDADGRYTLDWDAR